jgi:hypothetical protein
MVLWVPKRCVAQHGGDSPAANRVFATKKKHIYIKK